MKKLEKKIIKGIIPKRQLFTNKTHYGRVLLLGGNEKMGGAIVLAASACVASGAGLVTVGTHLDNHTPLHARLPEAMVFDLYDNHSLVTAIEVADVIIIGPGLGRGNKSLLTLATVLELAKKEQILIIDGDAITLIAENPMPKSNAYTIYTPHEGEWHKLSGLTIDAQKPAENQNIRNDLDSIVILKKHQTEIYFPKEIWQNQSGSPAMATGGMGDTLAGMIGGFLGQMHNKKSAILAAVFLHSYIADELAKTQYVALPSQVIAMIPTTMKTFESTLEVEL